MPNEAIRQLHDFFRYFRQPMMMCMCKAVQEAVFE